MEEKISDRLGWIACLIAVLMYVSYIDQIRLNLAGNPGSIILPIVTSLNCTLWVCYGISKNKKDWPIVMCNIPGVILGIVTFITAVIKF